MRVLSTEATRGDMLAALVDQIAHEVVVLDGAGQIILANEPFFKFGRDNGWTTPEDAVGSNYLSLCMQAAGSGDRSAARITHALSALLMGNRDSYATVYPCHSPWQLRWFRLHMTAWQLDGQVGVVMTHQDATSDIQAELAIARAQGPWVPDDETQYAVQLQPRLDALALRFDMLFGRSVAIDGAGDLAVLTAPDALLTALARLLLTDGRPAQGNVLIHVAAQGRNVELSIIGLDQADPVAMQALADVPGRCEVNTRQTPAGMQVNLVLRKARPAKA